MDKGSTIRVLFITLLLVIVLISAQLFTPASYSENNSRTIYYMTDPSNDDNGPGTYVYPLNPVFVNGAFDLLKLEIEVLENTLLFKFYISNLGGNPWCGLSGFSLQYIQVYIKTTLSDPVSKDTFGLNVKVDPGWHIAILINGGWGSNPLPEGEVPAIWYYRGGGQFEKRILNPGVEVYAVPELNTIVANLSRSYFIDLENTDNWMYVVFLTGYDGYSTYRVRSVVAGEPEEWRIGGGDASALLAGVAPFVMDVLLRTDDEQYRVLTGYDVDQMIPATVYMIYLNKIVEVSTLSVTETITETKVMIQTSTQYTTITRFSPVLTYYTVIEYSTTYQTIKEKETIVSIETRTVNIERPISTVLIIAVLVVIGVIGYVIGIFVKTRKLFE